MFNDERLKSRITKNFNIFLLHSIKLYRYSRIESKNAYSIFWKTIKHHQRALIVKNTYSNATLTQTVKRILMHEYFY